MTLQDRIRSAVTRWRALTATPGPIASIRPIALTPSQLLITRTVFDMAWSRGTFTAQERDTLTGILARWDDDADLAERIVVAMAISEAMGHPSRLPVQPDAEIADERL